MKPLLCFLVLLLWVRVVTLPSVGDDDGAKKAENSDQISSKIDSSTKVSGISSYYFMEPAMKKRTKRNFVKLEHKWPYPTIPYSFDYNVAQQKREVCLDAMKDIENNTCIRFKYKTGEWDYIYISQERGRCFSYVGKIGDRVNPLRIGSMCDYKKEIIHHLVHLLGMSDEHFRSDSDKFIKMDTTKMESQYEMNFHGLKSGNTVDEPYDYRSVMHVPNNYLGKDRKRPIVMKLMPGGPIIGQRQGLSELDARKLNKFYACKIDDKPKPAPKEDLVQLVSAHCNFDRGLCNWKNWKNGPGDDEDQFDWLIGAEAAKYSGLTHDYSENKPHGKFLYFIRPSLENELMSSGVLVSGFVSGPHCLWFRYHMVSGGHIRVFIKQANSSEKNPYEFITERKGRHKQLHKWFLVKEFISARPKPYQIFLEGLKTPDLADAVSLDDVMVYSGLTCDNCFHSRKTYEGGCCMFPFQYQQKSYDRCIKTTGKEFNGLYWCAITNNYDRDKVGRRCTDYDECYYNPCTVGATCVDLYFDYKCICPEFYGGKNCNEDIDECLDKPCRHGKCENHVRGYTCHCSRGYEGKNCQDDIDECKTGKHECGKSGKCANLPGSYKCVCNPGFTGPKCIQDIDECLHKPCRHGKCENHVRGYTCHCSQGYEGKNCQDDIKECKTGKQECGKSGKCENTPGSYKCVCDDGFTGPKCSQDIDECASSPCKNDGNCTNLVNRFQCTCSNKYTGKTCEDDVDECLKKPCRHGTCVNNEGGYKCKCARGYTGKNCETDIDECKTGGFDCGVFGTCANLPGSYTCVCEPGFTGPRCLQDIDDCASSPCGEHGVCFNLWNRFACSCFDGFTGKTCDVAVHRSQYPETSFEVNRIPWAFYGTFKVSVRYKGEHLTINCSTTDSSDYPFLWHKHKMLAAYEIVPDGRRIRQDGQIFVVKNLTTRDGGLYTCHAIKGNELRIRMDIMNITIAKRRVKTIKILKYIPKSADNMLATKLNGSKPYIYFDVKSPLHVSILEKKPFNLTATIKGLQPITVRWKRDELDLVPGMRLKTFNNNRRLFMEPPYVESDSGTYSAVACNSQGCQIRGIQVLFYGQKISRLSETAKRTEDVPLDEMLKKIGIIGGPAVVIILGLVLVYLKNRETTFSEKAKKTKRKRRKGREKEDDGGRATSLWSWHSIEEDSSLDEMPDYDKVDVENSPGASEQSDTYEALGTKMNVQRTEEQMSHGSAATTTNAEETLYENYYASFSNHVQSGVHPALAHVRQNPHDDPHDDVIHEGEGYEDEDDDTSFYSGESN